MVNNNFFRNLNITERSYEKLQILIAKAQQHIDNKEPDHALALLDDADHMINTLSLESNKRKEIEDQLEKMGEYAQVLFNSMNLNH